MNKFIRMSGRLLMAMAVAVLLILTTPVAQAAYPQGLGEVIQNSCCTGETVSVEQFNVNADQVSEAFWEQFNAGKLPWNLQRTYSYTYDQTTGQIKTFIPMFLDAGEYNYEAYERKVAEIIDETIFDGMSGWQKVLSVHDWLAAHFEYDETYTYYRGYDLLVRGTAVCNGYAEAYLDIMTRIGIPCVLVAADAMGDGGHAWNLVQLGGQWYHVDVTWDDPVSDTNGTVLHKYFLKTDAEMLSEGQEGHHSWVTNLTCTDTAYAEGFWNGIDSQICYTASTTSYLRQTSDWTGYIRVRNEQTGEQTLLHTIPKDYINVGAGEYAYEVRGLSLWNSRLYFSDQQTVYSMKPDGTDLKAEHYHDLSTGRYIHGCHVDDGLLYLTLADHDYNKIEQIYQLTVPVEAHVHSYVPTQTSATCVLDGRTTYSCSCGIAYEGSLIPATGHRYDAGVVIEQATRKENGLRKFTCQNCGDTYTEIIPMTGVTTEDPVREPEEDDGISPVLMIIIILLIIWLLSKLFSGKRRRTRRPYSQRPSTKRFDPDEFEDW